MNSERTAAVSGGINDLPTGFARGNDLGTSSWLVPDAGNTIRLPIAMDPRTGKLDPAATPQSHGSWLEKYRKWLQKNYGIEVDPIVETGWTVIQNGWIRKTGEPNALNYTISANDLEGNLRRVSDDIWATIVHYQKKQIDPSRISSHIDIWVDSKSIEPVGEFTLGEFMDANGDLQSLLSLHRVQKRRQRVEAALMQLADHMDRRGQYDLADRLETMAASLKSDSE